MPLEVVQMNIDEMAAGREMDALVAEAMGEEVYYNPTTGEPHVDYYSTYLGSAIHPVVHFGLHIGPYQENSWYAATARDWNDEGIILEVAATLPLAICRAALKALKAISPSIVKEQP